MSYFTILRAAFTIVRRHPSMLVAGFFIALILGWGNYSFLRQLSDFITLDLPLKLMRGEWQVGTTLQKISQAWSLQPLETTLTLLLPLIFLLGILVLSLFATSYLVVGTAAASEGWFTRASVWRRSREAFWPLCGLTLIIQITSKGFVVLLVVLTLGFLAKINPTLGSTIFDFVFFLVALPLSLVLAVLWRLSLVFLVTERRGLKTSFLSAWALIREHWLAVLEFAFLMAVFTILAGLAALILAAMLGAPFFLLSIILNNLALIPLAKFLSLAALSLVSLALLILGVFVITIFSCAWVVFTLTSREGGVESWLHILLTRRGGRLQ